MNLIIVSALIAIVLTLLTGVVYIDFLKKKMYGQEIRDCVPENHQKKSGTPTTGGVFIVLSAITASVITLIMAQKLTTAACLVILVFLFFMCAGLMDDILKIHGKQNEGLTPRQKFFLQIAISLLPALYVTFTGETEVSIGAFAVNLGWFYPIFAVFLITGVSNAVNLTDGLDGLASSNMTITMLACVIMAFISGQKDFAIISAAITGATLGFLYFNKYPAKVFMGDTGSLALGGVLATIAVMCKFELWLVLIGVVYLLEVLSVILQVASFKLTGNRIFKMSPIHHHFELCGWKETKVVRIFTLTTFLFSMLAIILYFKLQ